MIRTVVFDLGNVLVHFCHDRMCTQIGELCSRSTDHIREILIESNLQWEFERGRLSEREFHGRMQTLLQTEMNYEDFLRAGSDIFSLNEPTVPLLDELKRQGKRLVLLSNTSASHIAWIRSRYDLLSRFDEQVLSFEVGAIKPEPAIFEAALRAIDCDPAESFYTDDISEYVEKARSYGMHAEVFTGIDDLRGHLHARDIDA